jgi:hypothetical protein
LLRVVHHDGELVGEEPVGPAEDKIADVALQHLLLMALHAVVKGDRIGDFQP